jgi:predicted RNA-binding protein YlqC (UPF0109 family)
MAEDKIRELIQYVTRSLVEHPDDVRIEEKDNGRGRLYELTVHAEDRGRVIGKNGQTIRALRNLVSAAATLDGSGATVDVAD